jgi:hypothetical protein
VIHLDSAHSASTSRIASFFALAASLRGLTTWQVLYLECRKNQRWRNKRTDESSEDDVLLKFLNLLSFVKVPT